MEKAPVKHNRLRRMENHDYTLPCIYLITVTTEGRQRLLGTLVGDSAADGVLGMNGRCYSEQHKQDDVSVHSFNSSVNVLFKMGCL